jgi:hypothetical protein
VGFVLKHIEGTKLPLAQPGAPGQPLPPDQPAAQYVLVELATPRPDAGLRAIPGRYRRS